MSCRDRARRELELAGLFDADSDYDGMLGPCIMDVYNCWADQGHSGFSAAWTADILTKLFRGDCLTPNDHSDYTDHTEMGKGPLFQCNRDSRWFSKMVE